MSAQSLEIFPVNGSHYVSRGGEPIARFNTVKQAEEFLLTMLIPTPAAADSATAF